MSSRIPAPRPGDVLVLPESDYLYGRGPVVARVKAVTRRGEYNGEPWWDLVAEIAEGTPERHGRWNERPVWVREATLPRNRRPSTFP
jgi:hypothetical protein